MHGIGSGHLVCIPDVNFNIYAHVYTRAYRTCMHGENTRTFDIVRRGRVLCFIRGGAELRFVPVTSGSLRRLVPLGVMPCKKGDAAQI